MSRTTAWSAANAEAGISTSIPPDTKDDENAITLIWEWADLD